MTLPVAAYTVYDLTGKHVTLTIRRKGGRTPILFTALSTGGLITISNGGTSTQKITINIPQSTTSAHDSSVTLKEITTADAELSFSVSVRANANADVDWRVQGDLHWVPAEGVFD